MSGDNIRIDKCPVCGETHVYDITIQRSLIIQLMVTSEMEFPLKTEAQKFTRLFICPNKGTKYKATFELFTHSPGGIESVEIEDPEVNEK